MATRSGIFGPINRAGILRDYDFIVGLTFLASDESKNNSPQAVEGVYTLNGIETSESGAFVPTPAIS